MKVVHRKQTAYPTVGAICEAYMIVAGFEIRTRDYKVLLVRKPLVHLHQWDAFVTNLREHLAACKGSRLAKHVYIHLSTDGENALVRIDHPYRPLENFQKISTGGLDLRA